MLNEKINIVPMTKEYARLISYWKYRNEYSFYDHNESNVDGYMDGTHYACTSNDDTLIGYFCYGKDAQIPTVELNVYDDGYLDVGLGLKPELCGKGNGLSFCKAGLDYAKEQFGTTHFRLSVAAFNLRAVKVYEKAGFHVEREVTNSYFANQFYIMKYIREEAVSYAYSQTNTHET